MQTKTEYQIRSANGRVVMGFDDEVRARERYKSHPFGSNKLVKVTTTVEELNV